MEFKTAVGAIDSAAKGFVGEFPRYSDGHDYFLRPMYYDFVMSLSQKKLTDLITKYRNSVCGQHPWVNGAIVQVACTQ